MLPALTSCGVTDSRSLTDSATQIGKLRAKRQLPEKPLDCAIEETDVVVDLNDLSGALLLEGDKLHRQNARTRRCMGVGGFYDRVKASQERATQ